MILLSLKHQKYSSIYLSGGAVESSGISMLSVVIGTVVRPHPHPCFSHPAVHIPSLDVILLSSHSSQGLFLLVVEFSNHSLHAAHLPLAFVYRIVCLYFPSQQNLVLLLPELMGNHALFDSLIFVGHLLNVLPNLINSSLESFVHFSIA